MDTPKSGRYRFISSAILRVALIVSAALVALVVVFWLLSRIWWPDWTGFNPRSLWDVLNLVIVPLVLAGGAYWLNRQQKERELAIASQQKERELAIADDQKQETALQTYIDRMSDLLLNHYLREKAENSTVGVRSIAQARTSTVLRDLNDVRRGMLVRFLQESGLIANDHPIIVLKGVYLMDAVLTDTNLMNANLAGALLMEARLTDANLTGARLTGARLMRTHLTGATLNDADLTDADLTGALMVGVKYNEHTVWPRDFPRPIILKIHDMPPKILRHVIGYSQRYSFLPHHGTLRCKIAKIPR